MKPGYASSHVGQLYSSRSRYYTNSRLNSKTKTTIAGGSAISNKDPESAKHPHTSSSLREREQSVVGTESVAEGVYTTESTKIPQNDPQLEMPAMRESVENSSAQEPSEKEPSETEAL